MKHVFYRGRLVVSVLDCQPNGWGSRYLL